ncbi:MAG: magnesium transporter [Oligoflexia bacterium]|nr:magnesium transporter [Oligoflexia bacterium]
MLRDSRFIDQIFYLSEILDKKVMIGSQKIGRLSDIMISEAGKLPEVVSIVVSRPFGHPTLYFPWSKVLSLNGNGVKIGLQEQKSKANSNIISSKSLKASLTEYEMPPGSTSDLFFLKDQVLDKKVIDIEDNEVEVVYDVVLVIKNNKMYVSEVDCSRYGLLRRIGLRCIVRFIHNLTYKIREQTVSWSYIQPLPKHIDSFTGNVKLKVLKEKLAEMPPVDLADILEEMDPHQRVMIFDQLDMEQASDALEEIDPNVQRELIPSLKKEKVAALLESMTPGQAADTLSSLPSSESKHLLPLLNSEHAGKIAALLEQQEESIHHLASNRYIYVSPDQTAGSIERSFRALAQKCVVIMYLYVINKDGELIGVVDLKELLQAHDESLIKDIMTTNLISLAPEDTLKTAYDTFDRYGIRAIPIVDDKNHMKGVIPYRDVMKLRRRFV